MPPRLLLIAPTGGWQDAVQASPTFGFIGARATIDGIAHALYSNPLQVHWRADIKRNLHHPCGTEMSLPIRIRTAPATTSQTANGGNARTTPQTSC